jgi:hypothetical protein
VLKLLQLSDVRAVDRLKVGDLDVGLLNGLLEGLASYFSFILHSYAILVDACYFVMRDVTSSMRLHGLFDLQILLMCLFFEEKVPITGFLLPGHELLIFVHEVGTLGEGVSAVVRVVLLVGVQRLY